MALPEDTRHRLSQWCAARVPGAERGRRRVAYTTHGDEITISERRAPRFPELGSAWASHPMIRLRLDRPGTGRWIAFRPSGDDGDWQRVGESAGDPITLLERVV